MMAVSHPLIDNPPPGEDVQRRLRRAALGWLRSELDAWSNLLDSGSAKARLFVARTLEHWRTDTELTVIRDPDTLAKLPAEEVDQWRTLWRDVDGLLKKAQGEAS
jgi:hypothetical protein